MQSVIHLDQIEKSYIMGKMELKVLKGIRLDIDRNEYVALMGPSGSGKSTLMNIIGCLDTPTSGIYILNGHDISVTEDNKLAEIRNKEIGFVFQQFIWFVMTPIAKIHQVHNMFRFFCANSLTHPCIH